jgi:hypothetical protein
MARLSLNLAIALIGVTFAMPPKRRTLTARQSGQLGGRPSQEFSIGFNDTDIVLTNDGAGGPLYPVNPNDAADAVMNNSAAANGGSGVGSLYQSACTMTLDHSAQRATIPNSLAPATPAHHPVFPPANVSSGRIELRASTRRRHETERSAAYRSSMTQERRAAARARNSAARRAARAIPVADGPYRAAMPENMPSDALFNTHEINPHAALVSTLATVQFSAVSHSCFCPLQAFFGARMYNWRFAEWRNDDFAHMDPTRRAALCAAMSQEADVSDADFARFMHAYHARMDPSATVKACGCCGAMDVPIIAPGGPKPKSVGILSFTTVPLPSDAPCAEHNCGAAIHYRSRAAQRRTGRSSADTASDGNIQPADLSSSDAGDETSDSDADRLPAHNPAAPCGPDCPFLLAPLEFSPSQEQQFEWPTASAVPRPLDSDTSENANLLRAQWSRYRSIISMVAIDAAGHAVTRIGFGDDAAHPLDIENNAITPLARVDGDMWRRLHLYPQLCFGPDTEERPDQHYTALCDRCLDALCDGKVPVPSIAARWDLGTPEYANMPQLSLAERFAVSKSRILSTAINFELSRSAGASCL